MENQIRIREYFTEVETTIEHDGYFYSAGEALTIVILGSICGLRNVKQIHQRASHVHVSEFLSKKFDIKKIPCYYWLLCLLKILKPKSLNKCFMHWAQSFLPDSKEGLTLSFDGKTIRSTGKMDKYVSPLHIVSAQVAELGITIGQQSVEGKSNEIPAVRNLIGLSRIPKLKHCFFRVVLTLNTLKTSIGNNWTNHVGVGSIVQKRLLKYNQS